MKRKRSKKQKKRPKLKGRPKRKEITFDDEKQYEIVEYPTETRLIFQGFEILFKILRYLREYDINEDLLKVSEFQFYENYIPTKTINGFRESPKYTNRVRGYTRNLSFNCKDKNGDMVYIKYVPSNKFPVEYEWKDHANKYNPVKTKKMYRALINSISIPDVSKIIFVLNNFGKCCSSNRAKKTLVFKSPQSAKKFDREIYEINIERKKKEINKLHYEIISLSDTFTFYKLYKEVIDHNVKLCIESWRESKRTEQWTRMLEQLSLEEANSEMWSSLFQKKEKYIFFKEDGIIEELEEVVKKYGAIEKLPHVYLYDPYALMLGAKHGDVLKLTKNSETSGSICSYRYVSDNTRE